MNIDSQPLTADVRAVLPKTFAEVTDLPVTKIGSPILLERTQDGKKQQLVSCGNTTNPAEVNDESIGRFYPLDQHDTRTSKEKLQDYKRWLSGMIITDPIPTSTHSVVELREKHLLVGIYKWVDVSEGDT